MRHSRARQDWRYEHVAPATAGEIRHANDDAPGSLLTVAEGGSQGVPDDAALRHRLARLARETAQANDAFPAGGLEDTRIGDSSQADDFEDAFLPANDVPSRSPADPEGMETPAASGIARSKRLIAGCALLGAVAGGLVALSQPARYEATAELQVTGGGAAMGIGLNDQLRIIASGIVLNKVVDKLGLADDPAFNGAAANGGFLSLARSLLAGDDGAAASEAGHRHALAAARLADSLSTERGSGASTIAVTAATGNGETSALIANTVAETFMATAAAMNGKPRADGRTGADDEAMQKLGVFLARQGLANGDAKATADALLKLDDRLSAARARTADLNAQIAAMRKTGIDAAIGGGLPQEFETNAMAELRGQYLAIKRESDRAAARLGPRNPERIALDTQLAGARERIGAELRRIVISLQETLKQAVQTEQGLAERLAQSKLGTDDIATLRSLRDAAAQAAATASSRMPESAAGSPRAAVLLTRAYAPLAPSGPSPLPFTLAGLFCGLAIGTGIGAARGRRMDGHSAPAATTGINFGDAYDAGDATSTAIEAAMPAAHATSSTQGTVAGAAARIPTETAETPYPLEDPMYPVYADQMHPFAPRQPGEPVQQQFHTPPYAPHPYGAQPPMAAAMAHGAYVYAPYAPLYPWQPQAPAPAGFYSYPQPTRTVSAYPQPTMTQRTGPQPAGREAMQPVDQASLEEIRASLREFREAVRELAESRSRRRIL